jgi:hypothetical protein
MKNNNEWLDEWLDEECIHCGQPHLERSGNYDNCMGCGYWHCYTDGEGWIPPQHKTFTFYKTPGHGYLKVTKEDLDAVGVADKITDFSFVAKDGAIYLEEDCDFPMFDKAFEKRYGKNIKFKHVDLHDDNWKHGVARYKEVITYHG